MTLAADAVLRQLLPRGGIDTQPISSVLVAAEAISKCCASPAFSTISFITYSAMGLRQMLPWQMKRIFIIENLLL